MTLLVLSWTAYGRADDRMELKIATISPEGTSYINALHKASSDIEKATEGRIKFRIYPGGVMGNDAVALRKMRAGQIHGSTFTAGGMSASVDSNYQIMSLPLLFRDYRDVDAVRAKIEPALTRELDEKGYVSMGVVEAGFVYMMSDKPIRGVADLKSRKVWIPEGDPVSNTIFKIAGVPPIPLPLPDVLTGLQTGLIDTVSGSPVGAVVLQWFTKVKYLTTTPLLYSYGTFAFTKEAWEKIPEKDRSVVREALTRQLKQVDGETRKDNEAALETLKKQGIVFVQMDEKTYPEMQDIADRAIDDLMKQNLFNPAMVAEIRAAIQAVRQAK
jgi:TRAP-type C4-dicarboxylate transport system substrate-binding protein